MSVDPPPGAQDPAAVYIAALGASHWKTRWQAAQALGELEDTRAVEPLIEALDDSNQWVRIVAAEALGQIGHKAAASALVYVLDDPSIWVRRASVVALGQISDPCAVAPLAKRLLRPPDSEWPEELHDVIARALGNIGPQAVQVLIDALEEADVWVSSAAARALGRIGSPQAIAPLTALVQQENRWVRSAAIQALARIADARAVRAALTSDEAPRAFWKLMALKEIEKSTIRQLKALLEDPDEQIRTRAAQVLGQLGSEQETLPLTAALRTEIATRAQDELSLQTFAKEATKQNAKENKAPASERVKSLVTALQDPVADVRLAAAEALGKVGEVSATAALTRALGDPDSRVRAAAARALGQVGSREDK